MEAVITGAGSGLGRAFARELACRRFNLTLIDCHEERLADLERQLSANAVNVGCCACDVSSKSAVGILAKIEKTRVDLLINNAATSISAPFESTDPDAFDRVIGVNFLGAVNVTRAFLHRLGQGSQICNVCSAFSWSGFPSKSAYASSKAALKTFSETLRLELAARGIGVTALYPGPMPTQIVRDGISVDEQAKNYEHQFLQKHGTDPGHVARVALDRLRRNPARILIGSTYRAMDLSQRLAPSTALWLAGLIAKRSGF